MTTTTTTTTTNNNNNNGELVHYRKRDERLVKKSVGLSFVPPWSRMMFFLSLGLKK